MGTFTHAITLIAPNGGSETVEALVDTSALFSVFPAPLLERLGAKPSRTVRVRSKDGPVEEWPMGEVEAELNGERAPVTCLFGQAHAPAVIGTHALDAFLLAVDPVEKRLVPVEGWFA